MTADQPTRAERRSSVGLSAAIGAVAGASVTAGWGTVAILLGAAAGAVVVGVTDAVARARQRPGQIPALWSRIVVSAALMAPLGWAAGRSPAPARS